MSEPEPTVPEVSVHLDRATYEALRAQAEAAGDTLEDLVARLAAEVRQADAPSPLPSASEDG